MNSYYYSGQSSFDTNGVVIYRINKTLGNESPFNNILENFDLLLKCQINGTIIEFGNKNNQRTPGILLYYPVGTTITIYYKKFYDFNNTVYTMDIQLNKTYADVSNLLDGPLQSGYSYKDETYKNNINYIKINNHKIKKNYIKVDRELLEMRLD